MEFRTVRNRALVLVVALCALVAAIGVGVSFAAPSFQIAGTVTFAGATSDASATVNVQAYRQGSGGTWDAFGASRSVTASDGTFSIAGLPAGTYRIGFVDNSTPLHRYTNVYYDSTSTVDAATDISIVDTDAVGITQDLTAIPLPAIKGHVALLGADAADGNITAVPYKFEVNFIANQTMNPMWTAHSGSAVATDGTYSIEATAGATHILFVDAGHVYPDAYYDTTQPGNAGTSQSVATTVTFDGVSDTTGINATISPLPERKVQGHVHYFGADVVSGDVNAELFSQDASGNWTAHFIAPVADDGSYTIHVATATVGDGSGYNTTYGSQGDTYTVGFSDSSGVFADRFYDETSTIDAAVPVTVDDNTSMTVNATMTAQTSKDTGAVDAIHSALQASAAWDDGYGGPVVICSADGWSDAVCAGPYARAIGAPILLVHKDQVPSDVLAEIGRLDPNEVIIIGTASAVTWPVEQDIRQAVTVPVRRLAGADAYGTSAAVAQEMVSRGLSFNGDDGKLQNVCIVGGINGKVQSPYDAMCAAPVAAAQAMPVLLVKKTSVPAAVADFLDANESVNTNVLVVGGSGAVSDDLLAQLTPVVDDPNTDDNEIDSAVTRVAGADRYGTSVAVAAYAADSLGFSSRKAALAVGTDSVAALALSPQLAANREPLLLTAAALKRKATDTPGAYTWLSPATESFISKAPALAAGFGDAGSKADLGVLDAVGSIDARVWNYALTISHIAH